MVTSFVRSVGSRTKSMGQLIKKASRSDIRLGKMEYPSLKTLYHIVQVGSRFMFNLVFIGH